MEVRLHYDAFQKINKANKAYTTQESFLYKHLGSRLVLPVLTAMIGVAEIFRQLTRAIASTMNFEFKAAARDLAGIVVQAVGLPFVILGNFFAPTKTRDFLQTHIIKKYHQDFEAKPYNRVANFVISFMQIPAVILSNSVSQITDIFTPRVNYETKDRYQDLALSLCSPILVTIVSIQSALEGTFSLKDRKDGSSLLATGTL